MSYLQAFLNRVKRLRAVIALVSLLLLALYFLAASVLVFLATRPDRNQFEASPEDYQLEYEDVAFKPRGGSLTLRGWLFPGLSGEPHLILVHGFGDQRTGNQALNLAERLVHDYGYNVLVFDLRAQGESDGSRVTAGAFERDDVLGAFDFLISRGAEPGRVGLIGRSFGAAVSIMAAAREAGIAAVVADSPFADVQDLLVQEASSRTPLPRAFVPLFLPPARLLADLVYGIEFGDLRPEEDVSRLSYPVLVIHGEADERIPIEQGRRVYEAAPSGSEFWSLPGGGHADGFLENSEEYVVRLVAYLSGRFACADDAC